MEVPQTQFTLSPKQATRQVANNQRKSPPCGGQQSGRRRYINPRSAKLKHAFPATTK